MFNIDKNIDSNLWSWNRETGSLQFAYAEDILAEYQSAFKSIFPDINTDESTPQGQLITALVQSDLAAIALMENIINAFFFGGGGSALDLWAWNLYRVQRKSGVKSQVVVRISGIAGTDIPADFKVSDGGEHFYTIDSATRIGAQGFVEANFTADELDDFQAAAGVINEISLAVGGVERVSNEAAATEPTLRESDTALFARCVKYGALAQNASFKSILANVAQVEGVSKLHGLENYTSAEKTMQGLTLAPHSVWIIVKGGANADIAAAIMGARATGCGMNGDVTESIIIDSVSYDFTFSRPTTKALAASVTIAKSTISDENYESATKEAVADFINALDIGDLITQPNLANAVKSAISGYEIIDIQFGAKGGALGYSALELKGNEEAYIALDDIAVSVNEDL